MLQPIANIVITVFPDTLKILLDFSILINTRMMEEVFDDLVGNSLGIECHIGSKNCEIFYTRIWKGSEVALELVRILEEKDKVFTVYCQVEGEGVSRFQIK